MRRLVVPLVAALLLPGASALAAPPVVFHASYTAVPPTSVAAASAFVLPVTLGNVGPDLWPTSGPQPVNLSYHWIDAGGSTVVWDGVRTPLGANVDPRGSVTVNATVVAPPAACACILSFDLVREGVAWFQFLGSTPLRLPSFVAPVTYGGLRRSGRGVGVLRRGQVRAG